MLDGLRHDASSAADTTSSAKSMPVAPASMLCTKRSWPGTSTKPSCAAVPEIGM